MNPASNSPSGGRPAPRGKSLGAFGSEAVERLRAGGNAWRLPGGEILLPRVFGFCRGVERALNMLQRECDAQLAAGRRLFLLGEVIHNPWVNDHFLHRGVRILTRRQRAEPQRLITADDVAVIPAFGVPLSLERRLREVGCRIVDTSCVDVRRLWAWAERAARQQYGVLIFGRAQHDETVVTKSRLEAVGGRYVVAGNMREVRTLCELIVGRLPAGGFRVAFDERATNAEDIEPFLRLAQVSQTTMLYEETLKVRRLIRAAFRQRFGREGASERLVFQPTVCRATQDRQRAAVEMCRAGLDLVVVVGGHSSSNTRHLYELAREFAPAVFIEDARAILSAEEIESFDPVEERTVRIAGWLPARPVRIGVLAGASSPEIVVGGVLERLGKLLS